MHDQRLYGKRLSVVCSQGRFSLGYGTYIGEVARKDAPNKPSPRILLDTGECIFGHQCMWVEVRGIPEVSPFDHVHREYLRLFLPSQGMTLRILDKRHSPGGTVRILGFEYREWVYYPYVAAKIMIGPQECFALANDLGFPIFGS